MKSMEERGFDIGPIHVEIGWLFVSDWKAIQTLQGITGPNSTKGWCLWCFCDKEEITNFEHKDWGFQRSILSAEIAEATHFDTTHANNNGHRKKPLLPVEFENCVIDKLHLDLRIRGKMVDQVAVWCIVQHRESDMEREMDRIGVKFRFSSVEECDSQSNIIKLKKWTQLDGDALEKVCKYINLNAFLQDQEDKRVLNVDLLSKGDTTRFLDQLGVDYRKSDNKATLLIKLKNTMKDKSLLPKSGKLHKLLQELGEPSGGAAEPSSQKNLLSIDRLARLWQKFECLDDALKAEVQDDNYLEGKDFNQKARKFGNYFRNVTFDSDVTPYIHSLAYHCGDFLDKFGTIHQFSTQKLEKKNHWHQRVYFNSTQRSGAKNKIPFTRQIMQYENRKCSAIKENLKRVKRKYTKRATRLFYDRDEEY